MAAVSSDTWPSRLASSTSLPGLSRRQPSGGVAQHRHLLPRTFTRMGLPPHRVQAQFRRRQRLHKARTKVSMLRCKACCRTVPRRVRSSLSGLTWRKIMQWRGSPRQGGSARRSRSAPLARCRYGAAGRVKVWQLGGALELEPGLELMQVRDDQSFKVWSHGYPHRTVRSHFHPVPLGARAASRRGGRG
jgi:hypothetical protein